MRGFRKVEVFSASILTALVLLCNSSAKAQVPTYHPGETIRIPITFDGPDAPKISAVQIVCDTPKSPEKQPNFSTQVFPGVSKQSGVNTFEISYLIPDTQASGEYTLDQIRAIATIGSGPSQSSVQLLYLATEFPARKFTINNSQTLEKPKIKDVKELP